MNYKTYVSVESSLLNENIFHAIVLYVQILVYGLS